MSKSNVTVETTSPDITSSLITQGLLLKPRHLVKSPFLRQLPFLFWLLETARPRTVLQLGLGDGLVYIGVCQTIDRFLSGTGCIGIQGQGPALPPSLRQTHDDEYAELSILHGTAPNPSAADLPDITNIDFIIVHADVSMPQTSDPVAPWLPRLSNRAVIVVCSPAESIRLDGTALRASLAGPVITGPTMQDNTVFEVYLHGTDQPDRLQRLATRDWNDADRIAARQVFNRLGDTVEKSFRCIELQQQNDAAAADLNRIRKKLEALQQGDAALRAELARVQQKCEVAETAAAADRIRMKREMAEAAALSAQTRTNTSEEYAGPEVADLKRQLEKATKTQSDQKKTVEAAREKARADSKLIADLKRQINKTGAALKRQKEMQAVAARQHRKTLDEIYASTSWRATRALRGIRRIASRS